MLLGHVLETNIQDMIVIGKVKTYKNAGRKSHARYG